MANLRRIEDELERSNRYNQLSRRIGAGEQLSQEEIDTFRQSRGRTTQQQEQQDYYRRQAEQALAQFEANERARQWDAELGERHGFAADREAREYERRLQEAMRTARREAYSDPEYRAYNREIWKDTQRLQSNLDYAKQQAGRTVAAAQRQRDRIRNGSSRLPDYWERHAQAQEQKQYGSYMDRMSQPVRQNEVDEDQLRAEYGTDYTRMLDRSQSVQPDMNAASRYGQALGRPDSAMAEIDAKEAAAKRVKDYDIPRLQTVLDYEKSYGVSPALTGTSTWNPYEINTGVGKTGRAKDIAKAVYDSANGKITADTDEYNYNADLMTDAEKNTVINLAKAGKWAEILEYTDALQATLDAKTFDLQQQGIANMSKAAQAAYGMMGTVERAPAYLQIALDKVRGRYTDLNAGAVGATRLTNEARERSLENASAFGKFLGNAAYSTLDNAVLMPLGEVGALVWMSAGAAGQTAVETLEKGGTQGQALLKGAASGAVEYLTEKLPLENLFRIAEGKGIRGLKAYLKTVAKQMGTEGAEEIISEFADTFLDRAIMGQKSEYLTRIRELEADGSMTHDEAVSRANFEFFVKNPGLAAAAGALSGGFMAGASAGINAINTARADLAAGRDITNNRRIADVVLDEGMKSTDKRIRDMAYNLDAIRRENERSEGFQWSKADQRRIGEIYDSLDNDSKARVGQEAGIREAEREAEINEKIAEQEARDQAERDRNMTPEEFDEEIRRRAEASGNNIDMDNPETMVAEEPAAEPEQTNRRGSEEYTDRMESPEDVDADLRRRAAAAEEATRTGDRSALERLDQEPARREQVQTEAAPQTENAQQTEPVSQTTRDYTPEQAARQTADNARRAGLSAEDTLVMSNIARDVGARLEFQQMRDSRIHGFYNRETGTIVLNQDLSTAEMAWSTFAHEITHHSETAGSYKQLAALAKRFVGETAGTGDEDDAWNSYIRQKRRQYADVGYYTSQQDAEFEAVANTIENILNSREAMEGVARYSREDAQALLASIDDVLDRSTTNSTAITPESARLVQAQKALAAALGEVREQRATQTESATATQTTGDIPPEGVPAAESEDGEVLTREMPGGTVAKQYSLASWTLEERDAVRANLLENGFTEEQADRWISSVNSVAAIIAADRSRLDYEADPNQVMLKPNAEYVKTLDASTLCAKRLLYQGTFNAIQHRLPNTPLMPEELIEMANMMRRAGYETPCGICYVESRRRQLGKFAEQWLESYKGEYKPTLDQVTTSDGLAALRESHPQAYKDFVDAMNKKGTMNPKVVQLRTDYRGDVRKMTPGQIQKVKDIGGLRIQSFSDFEVPHMIDMMQAVLDMSAKDLTAQAYTKVPAFPWVFGDTGIKINLSLIGKGTGLDANGNLVFDDVEGMPFEEAMRLRDRYSKNVGTILVGINDAHILAAMADPRIDFIIPFHKSGWSAKELHGMPVLDSYSDYTNSQNEKKIVSISENGTYKTEALEASKRVNFQPVGENGYWDFSKSGKENAETYLRMCAEDGRIPKFSQFLVDNGDGRFSLQPDGSTDGYWKTLIDFKMYDNNGNGAAQQAVRPDFNMEEAQRILDSYSLDRTMPNGQTVSRESNNDLPVAQDIVDQFVEQYKADHKNTFVSGDEHVQYSLRMDDPPKKTITAYKAFYAKDGKLYPPMVSNQSDTEVKGSGTFKGNDTPVGVWLDADVGGILLDENGNPVRAKTTGRLKVQNAKSGGKEGLAFRPGWHLGEWPDAKQFNVKDPETGELKSRMPDNLVFAKCEIAADKDYQLDAMRYGVGENGKYNRTQAGYPKIPVDGYYKYRTNPDPDTAPWYITGSMKVVEILDDDQAAEICARYGVTPDKRASGKKINLGDYGLKAGPVTPTTDLDKYKENETNRANKRLLQDALNDPRYANAYVQRDIDFDDPEIAREFERNGQDLSYYRNESSKYKLGMESPKVQASLAGNDWEADVKEAVRRYGRMKPGEQLYYTDKNGKKVKATDESYLPKGTSEDTRIRGFQRTAIESRNVKADTRDLAVANQYRPTSNEENIQKAIERRGNGSFDLALGEWNSLVKSGRLSYKNLSVDIAFGERLLLEAQQEGNVDAVRSIITDLAEIGTTFGQATQAFSLLKRMSPEGQLIQMERQGKNYYDKLNRKGKYTNKKAARQVKYTDDLGKAADAMERLDEAKKQLSEIQKDKNHTAAQIKAAKAKIASINNEIKQALAELSKTKQDWKHTKGILTRDQLTRSELNREIKATKDRIQNALDGIKKTQTDIDRLQGELWALENKETNKKADRDALREKRKELKRQRDNMMSRIETLSRQIPQLQADIDAMFSQMAIGEDNEADMKSYRDTLRESRDIMKDYLRYVKQKGTVVIPTDLSNEYINAKTDEERAAVQLKIDRCIADQLPGTWEERIRAVRYISMLFNPTTHLRNISGNAMQYSMVKARDVFATLGEKAFLRNGEERYHAFLSSKKGADAKYWDAADADYKKMMDIVQGNRTDVGAHIEEMRRIFKTDFGEKIRRTSGETLEAEDRFWLSRHYKSAFAQYLKANKLDPANLTDEQLDRARSVAVDQAQRATYRDYSTFADQLNRLEKSSGAAEFFMGGLMPFKKTPINVLKRGVEYSPLGAIKTAADFVKLKRGNTTVTAADVINDAAQTLTGTLATALGVLLGAMGWAHASPGEDDNKKKKNFDKESGMQNYSIEIPGFDENGNWRWKAGTYTVDWLSPFSMPLFIGVRIAEMVKGQDSGLHSFEDIVDAASSIAEPIFQLSMLDGLTSALQSYQTSGAGVSRALLWSVVESYALQFFPTLGSKMARIIDPTQRSTKAFKYSTWFGQDIERLYRRILAKIPGATYALKPVIDQHGDIKKNVGSNVIERIGYNLASPGYYKYKSTDEADAETRRVYEALAGEDPELANSVLPRDINTYWELNGEKYYLNAEEYRKFSETQGKEETAGRKELYASEAYRNATDAEKAAMIKKVIDAAQEKAKIGFFEDIGVDNDYYRSKLNDSVYNKDGSPKNLQVVTDMYENGSIDLGTIYQAEKAMTGITKTGAKIDTLNQMIQEYNLTQDEYDFLYMTKIANQYMQDDMQAVLDAGGTLDQAINTVARFYKWDANAVDSKTGETGMWVSIGNGAKAEELAKSNMSLPAIEAMYLALTPTDDVEKQTELIDEFKNAGKNIKDYLNTKAVLYDGGDSKYKKTSDIAQAFLDSDLPDDLKELGYKTLGSDAQGVPDEIAAFKKARMTIDDYLRTKAVVGKTDANGNGLKNYEKARELLKMDLKSYTAAITSVITSSENQATGIQNCLNMGISDRKVAEGYAKYAQINANDALNATQKATEFSKWLNTDSSMSNLTTAQKDMMRSSFVYFMMTPASAGRYDNLMKLDGMSSNAAESISADIAKLEPKEGSKSVSDLQRLTAVAYNTTASEKQIDLAMQQILDSSDDGTDTAGLTKYRAIRAAGMSAKQYVDFRTNTESITSDKDSNGKDIKGRTRQDKIWAYINSLPITSKQKDALHLVYYKESTLSKTPWH